MPVTVKDFRGERQEKLPKVSINFFERVPFHANNGVLPRLFANHAPRFGECFTLGHTPIFMASSLLKV